MFNHIWVTISNPLPARLRQYQLPLLCQNRQPPALASLIFLLCLQFSPLILPCQVSNLGFLSTFSKFAVADNPSAGQKKSKSLPQVAYKATFLSRLDIRLSYTLFSPLRSTRLAAGSAYLFFVPLLREPFTVRGRKKISSGWRRRRRFSLCLLFPLNKGETAVDVFSLHIFRSAVRWCQSTVLNTTLWPDAKVWQILARNKAWLHVYMTALIGSAICYISTYARNRRQLTKKWQKSVQAT